MDAPTPSEVLSVWFGTDNAEAIREPLMDRWFKPDPAFDAVLRERFADAIAATIDGAFADWQDTPSGTLAYVVMLDQFSRNIHRGSALSFAADPTALAAAIRAVDTGIDQQVAWLARSFLYLPFEHSEALPQQDRAVSLYRALAADAPPAFEALGASFLEYAEKHRAVIVRFGRFPHRNVELGRESTDAERAFLTAGRGF